MCLKHLLLLCLCGVMLAETEQISLTKSVVSASRIDTSIDEAPGNVSVLSAQEIKLRPNAKFSETLRGFEGLQPSKSRGLDTFDSVRIRGISGAAIMVDGMILNDLNNNTKMLTAMAANDIEQVEVVRGAFSNLYGSGAVAGAINFVTTMPTEFQSAAMLGYGNALGSDYAPKNTYRAYAMIGDALLDKRLRLKLSVATTQSDGYAADSVLVGDVAGYAGAEATKDSNNGALRYTIGDAGKQDYATYDTSLKAEFDIGEVGTLSASARLNHYNYDHKDAQTYLNLNGDLSYGNNADLNANRPAPILYGRHLGKEDYSQLISAIGYKHYLPQKSTLEFRFYRIDGWDKFNNPDGTSNPTSANTSPSGGVGSQTNHKYEISNIDMIYYKPLNLDHAIISGISYRHNRYFQDVNYIENWKNFDSIHIGTPNSGFKQGGKTNNIGIFAEWSADWWFLRGLSSNFSVRYDYWKGFDIYRDNDQYASNQKDILSPKIALNYAVTASTRLKTSFGQAFKTPTFGQMFSNRALTDGTYTRGNPNLKPESVISFDIGIEQDLIALATKTTKQGLFKMYYFDNTISDAIAQYSNTYPIVDLRGGYDNLGKNHIYGIESSLYEPLWQDFSIFATYTFTDSTIKKSIESSTEGNKVAGIPAHLAYLAINYEGAKIYGSFGVEYASRPYKTANNIATPRHVYGSTDDYLITDFKVGYKINSRFDIDFNITNLFNQTYYSYYRASGRSFFIALNGKL